MVFDGQTKVLKIGILTVLKLSSKTKPSKRVSALKYWMGSSPGNQVLKSLFLSIILAIQVCSPPVQASAFLGNEEQIEHYTTEILLKEIDLERYYNKYRLFASKDPKFRYRRYFLLQQAAAGMTLGSYIASTADLGKNLTTPDRISQPLAARTTKLGFTAVVFQGGSSAIELASNVSTAIKHKVKKIDPKSTAKNIQSRLQEIDALMAQRNALVEQIENKEGVEILQAEGRVLKYFRDWCLNEFADIYADAKSYQASNSIYYVLDITSATLYGASYLISLRALDKPHLFNPAAKVGIVGDGFGIVSAPLSSWSYSYLYNHHRKKFGKNLKEKLYDPEETAKGEILALKTRIENSHALSKPLLNNIHARLSMIDFWSCEYDDYIAKTTLEDRRFSKVALQSNISGPIISTAFLAQDVMALVAANSFKNQIMKATSLGFASTIPPLVASGASLLLTSYWAADEGIHQHILKKKGHTPEQLIAKRFAVLGEMETKLQQIEK